MRFKRLPVRVIKLTPIYVPDIITLEDNVYNHVSEDILGIDLACAQSISDFAKRTLRSSISLAVFPGTFLSGLDGFYWFIEILQGHLLLKVAHPFLSSAFEGGLLSF